jgi:hypothetical protein
LGCLEKGLGSDLNVADSRERVKQALGGIRQPAKVTDSEGNISEVSPKQQITDKTAAVKQSKDAVKTKAETEAAARRAQFRKEGVLKSEEVSFAKNGQWSLDKAVREPSFGSAAVHENDIDVEGAAKEKKYQGGDPRHFYSRNYETRKDNKTRAGIEREIPGSKANNADKKTYTSGVSEIRPKEHSEYSRKTTTQRGTNKEVEWNS